MPRRPWMLTLSIVASASLVSVAARAEDPPLECTNDGECADGGFCDGWGSCWAAEYACVTSTDCPEGHVCGYDASYCPPEGAEVACPTGTRGRCEPPYVHPCSLDAECTDDELCWPIDHPVCAVGDDACAARTPGACVGWSRFCDASSGCAGACVENRCIDEAARDEAAAIVIDDAKSERLRQAWGDRPPGGCSASAVVHASSSSALLLLGAALAVRRRRRH